ncbi:MAG TPA: DegT/DnrJ/EryC1/StrS family aminotransferase [bacterium]|nr:DegT/DnrJ/EryC1/StrS family aminotransferase [bacterium]
MNVPFLDIKACFHPLKKDMFEQLEGIFDRCDFVLGKPVKDFEEAVKEYCNTRYALGVANGTDALIIALRAAGVSNGDNVITSPFTFIASAESVNAAGGTPVFCDISPSTYNLDPVKALEYIESNCEQTDKGLLNRATGEIIKAVLPVHLYGLMADMKSFLEMKNKYGIGIIEDAAQSFGAKMDTDGNSMLSGAIGDVGCFSFYPSKNLGGAGDGGMIVTNDEEIYKRAKKLHVHGSDVRYYHDVFGYNSRLDSIQAAILLVKLSHVDEWIKARISNAGKYNMLLKEKLEAIGYEVIFSSELPASGKRDEKTVVLPSSFESMTHTYNTYEIRLPDRDNAQKALADKGIGSMIYYPLALHEQKAFAYLNMKKGALPVTETICEDILALPQFPELTDQMIEYVADSIAEFLNKK